MNGMHVIYVPPSVLKNFPAMWLQMVTKHRGTVSKDTTHATLLLLTVLWWDLHL